MNKMNKKAQLELDDISIVGIIFGLVGVGIGILIAKQMDSPLIIRLLSGLVSGAACYFVGGKIADG